MEQSRAHLTIAVDGMLVQYLKQLERLLSRLASHGDHIFVIISDSLCERVTIDLLMFNLVMDPGAGSRLSSPAS